VNGDCDVVPVVNGEHKTDDDAARLNAVSDTDKGFKNTNVQKPSERTVRSDNKFESSEENEFGEDSLSGIEDLVDYVTQS